ncbi:flagellar biosynthesis anti-sigma factor FlgM [Clostridium sardiniense]|uniref:Negative regulator of flagellin synthesis n=1 Tax=Clostridium sardiniense TaxID=29369 RepID=A0ABS7KVJ2_CLOSR|nr:flagellar biosynthesis anti-sigma factor FlgM [Clostridium sardiniense]MBY0754677.1 flagellar biosynthesis anti-sigma factor FlgM [Clostridium sardiniense]MDQ0460603.1 negative regulator of flagellin synthesis FlgM [Clostridium sardiniense]
MKIDSIRTNNMINVYKQQKFYEKTSAAKNEIKDKVEISDTAKYLNKIVSDNENIDIDKINEIRNRINQGTYSVDSKDLAKKMIEVIKGE